MPKITSIPIGTVFTRLTVISTASPSIESDGSHRARSKCRCICGVIVLVRNKDLKRGKTKSCGCFISDLVKQRNFRHGLATRIWRHPLYDTWCRMHQRCNNPKDADYYLYGARGIRVCKRWKSFASFLEDMGNKPSGHSLDRIDCNGNYKPINCRWADPKTQARNNRFHKQYAFGGVTANLSEHCERLNLNYHSIRSRLRDGWTVDRALSEPLR